MVIKAAKKFTAIIEFLYNGYTGNPFSNKAA